LSIVRKHQHLKQP